MKARAHDVRSCFLCLLNHNLFAVLDIEATYGLRYLTTAEVEDAAVDGRVINYTDASVDGW